MRRWLMFAVIILGICMTIAVPNLKLARHRSQQKRTLYHIRTVSTAIEGYIADHPEWTPLPFEGSAVQLKSLLPPEYVKQMPVKDAWDYPLGVLLSSKKSGDEIAVDYQIWSPGEDGKRDPKWGSYKDGTDYATRKFENDLVFTNGVFTQYPEGL